MRRRRGGRRRRTRTRTRTRTKKKDKKMKRNNGKTQADVHVAEEALLDAVQTTRASVFPQLSPVKLPRNRKRSRKPNRKLPILSETFTVYDQQLGVKKSWSDWMSRREDEKAHINTLRRSKSYVKMSIDAHQKRLDTMAQIFNPTRIKEIQDSFKDAAGERK